MARKMTGSAPKVRDGASKTKALNATGKHTLHFEVHAWKHGADQLARDGQYLGHAENDVTVNGIDWILDQLYINRSAGERGANFLALSANQTDTTTSDTTFTGEIQGSGLARVDVAAAGGITHADNTNTVVLSHVFTASAAVANIHKAALFQSSTETQPINVFTFSSDTTLGISERLTVSWTISIS